MITHKLAGMDGAQTQPTHPPALTLEPAAAPFRSVHYEPHRPTGQQVRDSSRHIQPSCRKLGVTLLSGVAVGSMGLKVEAAYDFAHLTGERAVIGALEDLASIIDGVAATQIASCEPQIAFATS